MLAPFTHPLFAVLTGIGIGIAARTTTKALKLAPLAGYLAAVCLHALWNGAALLGGSKFLTVYFLIMLPLFVGVFYLVLLQRRREQRIVAAALPAWPRRAGSRRRRSTCSPPARQAGMAPPGPQTAVRQGGRQGRRRRIRPL